MRWYTILAVSLFVMPAAVHAAELDKQISIDIPANSSLDEALLQWVRLTGVPLMSAGIPQERTAERVRGKLSARQALSALLRTTGFTYVLSGDSVVVVLDRSAASPQAPREMASAAPVRLSGNEPELESVVTVTGSHISNALSASVIILDQQAIARSGLESTGELIRSLPQSFGGGLNGNAIGVCSNRNTLPQPCASTADLRGMGTGSTLVLIDGLRVASAETSGAVELDMVPLAAIERIEILPDGGSAIYGSDAVAGVVNIILRKDFEGAAASAVLGGATEGGGYLQQYGVIAGGHWPRGQAVASVTLSRQSDVDSTERSFAFSPPIQGTSLLPATQSAAGFMALEHHFTPSISASIEGLWTKRSSTQTDNLSSLVPGLAATTAKRVTEYAVMAAAETEISDRWRARVATHFASDAIVSPQSLTADGSAYASEGDISSSRLWSMEAMAEGVLAQLPAGDARLALGAGYRRETFRFSNLPDNMLPIKHARGVRFAFAEGQFPLVRAMGNERGRNELMLTLASRWDQYENFGSIVNRRIELAYIPLEDLRLSASWSTSFRAPTLLQQYDTAQAILVSVPDRDMPGGTATVLERFGGNPRLQPEVSSATALTLRLTPSNWPGLSAQFAWYNIKDRGRIEFPSPNTGNPLSEPNAAPFIVFNPSRRLVAETLEGAQFSNRAGAFYNPADVVALVDDRYQNISRQTASGFDLETDYSHSTPIGRLDLSLNFTYLALRERVTDSSPYVPLSGTVFYPPRYRSRSGVCWARRGWTAAAFLNYIGSSKDTSSTPSHPVASWSTVDSQLGFASGRGGVDLALSVQNLLDRRPPQVDAAVAGLSGLSFDSTNTSAVGRLVSLRITRTW